MNVCCISFSALFPSVVEMIIQPLLLHVNLHLEPLSFENSHLQAAEAKPDTISISHQFLHAQDGRRLFRMIASPN